MGSGTETSKSVVDKHLRFRRGKEGKQLKTKGTASRYRRTDFPKKVKYSERHT